jgi:hypothetical protein
MPKVLMDFHYFKSKKESIPAVLLGVAAVFAVLIVVKATSFFEASARAQNLVKMASVRGDSSDEAIRKSVAASETIAEELKKRNLFSPLQPPHHPVTSVLGILGDEALIGDKWYKVGDVIDDAEIIAIEPTQVRIRWQGRETVFVPMEVAEGSQASGVNSARRILNQAEDQASGPENRGPVSSGRAERSRTAKSVKVPESDKTKAAAKQKSQTEKNQYEKLLKQDIKVPKKKTATADRTNSDAAARKKAAAAQAKKQGRKSSR